MSINQRLFLGQLFWICSEHLKGMESLRNWRRKANLWLPDCPGQFFANFRHAKKKFIKTPWIILRIWYNGSGFRVCARELKEYYINGGTWPWHTRSVTTASPAAPAPKIVPFVRSTRTSWKKQMWFDAFCAWDASTSVQQRPEHCAMKRHWRILNFCSAWILQKRSKVSFLEKYRTGLEREVFWC